MEPDDSPDSQDASQSNESIRKNGQDRSPSSPDPKDATNEVEYLGGIFYVYVDAPEETPADVKPTAP